MRRSGDDAAMAESSAPSHLRIAQLALAYLHADYFVAVGRREGRFRIGELAADIEAVLGAARYLFITAWNPVSEELGLADNISADQQLQSRLQQAGFQHHSAIAADPAGCHKEHGWLVLDLPEATADLLAREFRQAGVVYWQRGQPARLRMQAPQPPQWEASGWVDWTG